MNVRVKADPQALAAAGSALAGIAQRMADDVAALETTVAGPAGPWGDDENGSVFALAYQAVLGHALQALGSHVQQIGEAAIALHTQARAIAAVDDEAAAGLHAAGGPS
jgi:nicotinamide mononucleotide (NMN) deamidase PncC